MDHCNTFDAWLIRNQFPSLSLDNSDVDITINKKFMSTLLSFKNPLQLLMALWHI